MKKWILLLCVVLLCSVSLGCARQQPDYDARAIDSSEVDDSSSSSSSEARPAAGGGTVLRDSQW